MVVGERSRPVRKRIRVSYVVLASLAGTALLVILFVRSFFEIWPTSPPFPARYEPGSESATQFAEFNADGTMTGQNLPVWGGESCAGDPALVSGEGRWYQDWRGNLWIDLAGQRVKWDPGVYRGWPTWEKIVLQYCSEDGDEERADWYGDWLG